MSLINSVSQNPDEVPDNEEKSVSLCIAVGMHVGLPSSAKQWAQARTEMNVVETWKLGKRESKYQWSYKYSGFEGRETRRLGWYLDGEVYRVFGENF